MQKNKHDNDKGLKIIAFGPVPSRRLGQSIGINNIPTKICTYSCIYCQLGRTQLFQSSRQPFYTPQEIVESVKQKIHGLNTKKKTVDYLTFVSNGEPTLDSNLGEEIRLLKSLGIRIAVITNASLLWRRDVCDDLRNADWVSLKIDTVNQKTWHRINRPYRSLKLKEILDGIVEFSNSYTGDLATETMLIQDINNGTEDIKKLAEFLGILSPKKSYLSIPIRPPAEPQVKPAVENKIIYAFQAITEQGVEAECLLGYEGSTFAFTGPIEEELLGIMSVHPMREENVRELLLKTNESWTLIEKLLDQKKIIQTEYKGKKFYIRKFTPLSRL
jgi:wyosine [tRNA(Phe)-imidazoG37] synthetase (radical SAM superfamily)